MTRHIEHKILPKGVLGHRSRFRKKRKSAKGREKERGDERVNVEVIWRPCKGRAEESERKEGVL